MAKHKKNNNNNYNTEATSNGGGGEKKIITDPRFSAVHSDPRFQKVPKQQSKVTIDSRFNRMFTDKNFASSSAPVDKRGKPKKHNSVDHLRQYYNIEQEEEEEEEHNLKSKSKSKNKIVEADSEDEDENESEQEENLKLKSKSKSKSKKKIVEADSDDDDGEEDASESESESESEEEEENLKSKSKSRPEKKIVEDESEDEDEDEDEDEEEDESESEEEEEEIDLEDLKKLDERLAGDGGSTDSDTDDDEDLFVSEEESEEESEKEEIPQMEEETHRLAVVKMDWSQVRAVDLYVVLNSFVPKGGQILSVSVYPTEFGQKRMEEEAVKGPIGLFDSDKEKSDDEKEGEFDQKKLRAYEKSRLRYYFAVVECDSSATASYIYRNCDGLEFESSSNKLDLRFIPDAMQFEHPPRDVATEVPPRYERLDFKTDVLQKTNITLSWDMDEPHRVKALKRKLTDYEREEMDLIAYIAPDDSDDDENDEAANGQADNKVEKYRALLGAEDGSDGDDGDNDNDMEVTFNTGLEDISKRILEKKKDKESETVWEAHLRRRKEKKKAMKNKSKDSSDDESSDSDREAPEEPDDFFVKEPSAKNGVVGRSIRGEQQEEDRKKEQEASRAELELLLADDQGADHNLKGYNLKTKKSKGKKGKEVPAEDKIPSGEYDDPRFSKLFTSPLFALDPTDAQYKRSAAYARQVAQRQHKGGREETADKKQKEPPKETLLPPDDTSSKKNEQSHPDSKPSKMENPEISSLIRSMKRKAEQYQTLSNGNAWKKVAAKPAKGLLPKLSAKFLSSKKKARVSKS